MTEFFLPLSYMFAALVTILCLAAILSVFLKVSSSLTVGLTLPYGETYAAVINAFVPNLIGQLLSLSLLQLSSILGPVSGFALASGCSLVSFSLVSGIILSVSFAIPLRKACLVCLVWWFFYAFLALPALWFASRLFVTT